MSVADVIIHTGGSPVRHKKLDCASVIRVILPPVQECRRTKRSARLVAEVLLSDGRAIVLGSVDGDIEIKEVRPLIGSFRTILGIIPMPAQTQVHMETNDFAIQRVVVHAFGRAS